MIELIKNFWFANWANILLVAVGASAFVTYWLQDRRKKIDAACLLVLQIDELLDRIREISTYISDGQLNRVAFYNSLPLMEENYWNKYKHYFVRNMDSTSYSSLNQLYNYASGIQEQQQLMKDLQKNGFYQTQLVYINLESQMIFNCLGVASNNAGGQGAAIAMNNIIANNASDADKENLNQWIQKMISQSSPVDMNTFWGMYRQQQSYLGGILDQEALTKYIPNQIRISLEKAIKETSMLGIVGSEGYQALKKISKRKF